MALLSDPCSSAFIRGQFHSALRVLHVPAVNPLHVARITVTMSDKPRILTGDTPTGKLHLGHYVGSVENRVAMQDEFDCYFIIANKHAFTTRADRPADIRQSVIDIATDYL